MKIDPADLLDSRDVADALGLKSHTSVAVYRGRYDDFPEPVIVKASGNCTLWLRADIESWAKSRRR